jgi:hypothetical protein
MVAAPETTHSNGVNGHARAAHSNGHSAKSYSVQEHTIGQHRKLRAVFIGAGASGITWHYIARHLDWLEYQSAWRRLPRLACL